MRLFWALLSETFYRFLKDNAQSLGAALAYYAAFSMAPLLILLVAIADYFYQEHTLPRIQSQLALMAGHDAADAIVATMHSLNNSPDAVTPTVVSIITLLIGATGMFGQLQDAMNTIWEVPAKPRQLWFDVLRTRLLSFSMALAICFLLLLSLGFSAFLATTSKYFQALFPFTASIWPLADFVFSFAVVTILFAAIFKILPDVDIGWKDVWLGASATAALFTVGKIVIGLYLGRLIFASAYGAAGSFLVLLAWVYYSAQILFFGAEFTRVYTNYRHRRTQERKAA
jgi:membrane protein